MKTSAIWRLFMSNGAAWANTRTAETDGLAPGGTYILCRKPRRRDFVRNRLNRGGRPCRIPLKCPFDREPLSPLRPPTAREGSAGRSGSANSHGLARARSLPDVQGDGGGGV